MVHTIIGQRPATRVRLAIARGLTIFNPLTLKTARRLLRDEHAPVREWTLLELGSQCVFPADAVERDLRRMLRDPSPSVRDEALRALAYQGFMDIGDAVAERLRESGVSDVVIATIDEVFRHHTGDGWRQ